MLDQRILKKFNCTRERLKEVFTAVGYKDSDNVTDEQRLQRNRDVDAREKMEKLIQDRLSAAILFNLRSYTHYSAADMAWDFTLNPVKMPLILYAQGKIKLEACANQLKDLPNSDKYLKKNSDNVVTGVDLPKFLEVECNLVRSYTTRRVSAQSNKYSNLWPYYKYESRSTGLIGKLRADLMSQRADIMADDFGYRHHDRQVYRDGFLYGHSVDFVRASWEVDKQWVEKPIDPALKPNPDTVLEVMDEITREGIAWVNPHPTRVFWDIASPLASINTDSGCEYIGFWDMCRGRDITKNPAYFNRDNLATSSPLWQIFQNYRAYFDQYYSAVKPPPSATQEQGMDVTGQNDRLNNLGIYSGAMEETGAFKAEYFQKLVPKDWGLGDYPFPVWVRLVVANERTVVYGEFLPSTPAAYLGINESDSRLVNVGFAHEIMPYQDQMTNLIGLLLSTIQAESFKVISVNTDVINKREHVDYIRQRLRGQNWADHPLVIEYSESDSRSLDLRQREPILISETRVTQTITNIIQAMAQLINLVEKLMAMSPAEQGQPAPREISATEVNEISSTTSSVYNFVSDAIDDFHAAKKRIIYESTMSCTEADKVRLPVLNRYSEKTIKKAGFEPIPEENEDFANKQGVIRRTLIGSIKLLKHNFIFTTRDGAERPTNTQAANTLVQMLAQIIPMPSVLQAIGKEKLYNILNEIFRLSGTGIDLNLELAEGEDNSLGVDQVQQLQQTVQQLAQMMNELANQVKGNAESLAQQEQINNEQGQQLQLTAGLAQELHKLAQEVQGIVSGPHVKLMESLNYKDAPDDIKRQIEYSAGFTPSKMPSDEGQELQQKAEEHQLNISARAQTHQQTIAQRAEEHRLKMAAKAQEAQQGIAAKAAESQLELKKKHVAATTDLATKEATSAQDLRQKEEAHQQQVDHTQQMAAVQREVARKTATTKAPTSNKKKK